VGGEIYGQGSSREAAVLSPLHLGVRAVLAKSFARIHRANLVNWGIVPLEFEDPADYDGIERDDVLDFEALRESVAAGGPVAVTNERTGARFRMRCTLSPRERDMLLAGGLLAQTAGQRTPPHPALPPSGGEGGGGRRTA
jgi:aconitate hydratase